MKELFIQAKTLQNLLISRATGGKKIMLNTHV